MVSYLFYSSIKLLVITWVDKISKLSDYRNTYKFNFSFITLPEFTPGPMVLTCIMN